MLDVAVHADGAAVDDTPDARGRGGFDELPDRRGIDRAIDVARDASLAIYRSDVVHDVDILDRRCDRCGIAQVADRDLESRHIGISNGVSLERPNLIAT